MYLVNEQQFKVLKSRFEYILKRSSHCLDQRLLESIRILKDVDGIVPVWSCSGHTEEESGFNKEEIYITFAVNEKGKVFLDALDAVRKELAVSSYSRPRIYLDAMELVWGFNEEMEGDWYPVWSIRLHFQEHGLEKTTKIFNDIIKKTVEKVLQEKKPVERTESSCDPTDSVLYRFTHKESGLVRYTFLKLGLTNEEALKQYKLRLGKIWISTASVKATESYIPNFKEIKAKKLETDVSGYLIERVPYSGPTDRASKLGFCRVLNTEELRNYRQKRLKVI